MKIKTIRVTVTRSYSIKVCQDDPKFCHHTCAHLVDTTCSLFVTSQGADRQLRARGPTYNQRVLRCNDCLGAK